eukprot:TRINITY_DN1234_c0_g1_i3.p1 TRINITY_DN1234_c0_g1~~TRINITY_DN1234_c0_g1_i3.p1  ORF type:complete len:299 (-),score=33.18 TRINITY_DN1234_c0_g1_i3:30-926(-)
MKCNAFWLILVGFCGVIMQVKSRDIIFAQNNTTLARLSAQGELQAAKFRGGGEALDLSLHPQVLKLSQDLNATIENATQLSYRVNSLTDELQIAQENATILAGRVQALEDQISQIQSQLSNAVVPLARKALYTSGSPIFTVPNNVSILVIEAYGGGGGGTYGNCYNSGYTCYDGSGGGGGGYVEKTLLNVRAGTTISMTIGGGGGPSSNGGQTTVTVSGGLASLVAGGGGGGCCYTTRGAGGSASGGDLNIAGAYGGTFGDGGTVAGRLGGSLGRGGSGAFSSNVADSGLGGGVLIMY